jgi:(p)ppGpp synthase/HD superfamily hydrolase
VIGAGRVVIVRLSIICENELSLPLKKVYVKRRVYDSLYQQALDFAWEAHRGQKDKSGVDYIYHPIAVAAMLDDEVEKAAALLHDVVEDCGVTLDGLRKEGFPEPVVYIVDALTRREGEKYFDFVRRTKSYGPAAVRVKIADLTHNMSPARLDKLPPNERGIVERYKKAMRILTEE